MKKKRTSQDNAVDRELIAKGQDALRDFDESQALRVPAKKRESKLISIRLPMDLLKRLRESAFRKGDIGYQQLIKTYLAESVEREEMIDRWAQQMKTVEAMALPIFIWHSGEGAPNWRSARYSKIDSPSFDVSTNRLLDMKERR